MRRRELIDVEPEVRVEAVADEILVCGRCEGGVSAVAGSSKGEGERRRGRRMRRSSPGRKAESGREGKETD